MNLSLFTELLQIGQTKVGAGPLGIATDIRGGDTHQVVKVVMIDITEIGKKGVIIEVAIMREAIIKVVGIEIVIGIGKEGTVVIATNQLDNINKRDMRNQSQLCN